MNLWRRIAGTVTLSLVSADLTDTIAEIISEGITIYNATSRADDMEMVFTVRRADLKRLQMLARRKGFDIRIRKQMGVALLLKASLRRPVLTLSVLLVCFLTYWIPQRVLFIQVQGNRSVSTRQIVEACVSNGLSFGASRAEVRSEQVKNALLQEIPQLQWAGVNTAGCVATVTVRERAQDQQIREEENVASLIASADGVVTRITVTNGTPCCKVGQAVRRGDMLVSGYTDCGIAIRAGRAEGEIYANTTHHMEAIAPADRQSETEITEIGTNFAILIGKKRINFYKGSGISGTTCDKIHSEYYLTLPGGFILPVALVVEQWSAARDDHIFLGAVDTQKTLSDFGQWYLKEQMTAGRILGQTEDFTQNDDTVIMKCSYACEEMIARVRNEEIILPNGNDH